MIRKAVALFYFLLPILVLSGQARVDSTSFQEKALSATPVWTMPDEFLDELEVAGVRDWPEIRTDVLESWTEFGLEHARSFAGAARYTIKVDLSDIDSDNLLLDLGDVLESARVWVNHRPAGAFVAHPYRLDISEWVKEGLNEISIEVTNLSSNRIRDLDIRGVEWKKFYDINFVSHLYEPFDASDWPIEPSGLLGPVKLIPVQIDNF